MSGKKDGLWQTDGESTLEEIPPKDEFWHREVGKLNGKVVRVPREFFKFYNLQGAGFVSASNHPEEVSE